jgi:cell wall-associated NlpC family hydrolase
MKLNKEKMITIVSAAAIAVAAAGTSVVSYMNNKPAEAAEIETETSVTAGVSNVLAFSDVIVPSFTSGVSSVLNDFPSATIAESDIDVVAQGMEDDTDAEEVDDGTFCGYTNLGIANVDTSNLNIREEPSTSGKIVGKMTKHNACEILETDGDWYKIKSGKVTGYVSSEYILTGDEALAIAQEEVNTYATVTTDTLRVRSEATTDSKIISLVNKGEDLVVVEEDEEWALVEVDDEEGYVYKEYVTLAQKLPTAKTITEIKYGQGVSDVRVELVQYALQFVGNRYVWGGESLTKGVDCSGFTMKIYEKFGIYLPHSSRAQPSYGTKIKASQAQPGDLFFYGSGSHISHVGIYIGDGKIVHASNKRDGIKISNSNYRTPICVVRYLD